MKAFSLQKNRVGFSLVELLVVLAVFSLLVSTVFVHFSQLASTQRDTQRIADMRTITTALDLYFSKNHSYPAVTSSDPSCGGWETSVHTPNNFLHPLVSDGELTKVPVDPLNTGLCTKNPLVVYSYFYYHFTANDSSWDSCDPSLGSFYVLAVYSMETSAIPTPNTPGWSCPSYLNLTFPWVTGKTELKN